MNIKKELSRKEEAGKKQILVRVDVSRTVRPSLKTGIFTTPELFDPNTGSIAFPKQSRKNETLVTEAQLVDRLLQSFLLRLNTLCQQDARDMQIDITKDWLVNQMASMVEQNIEATLGVNGASLKTTSPTTEKKSRQPLVPVPASVVDAALHPDRPVYESQDFYRLLVLYCERKQLSESRTRCYKTLARQLRRFELYQQVMVSSSFVLNYDSLTTEDLEAFRIFVRNEADYAKKNPRLFQRLFAEAPYTCNAKRPRKIAARGDNYISGLMKRLAAVFHWLLNSKKTTNDPFDGFDFGQEEYGDPIYITREESDTIATFDLSGYNDVVLEQQRDIFVFHCLCGCRVGDLRSLRPANIVGDILEYVPKKTKKTKGQGKVKIVRVPMNAQAQSLIKKYEGVDKRGRLFPFLSDIHYNLRIKEIFEKCGINRIVQVRDPKTGDYLSLPISEVASSHMGRRTFIGIAYQLTHDPNLIAKMTGHVQDSRAFSRYYRIDDDDLRTVTNAI